MALQIGKKSGSSEHSDQRYVSTSNRDERSDAHLALQEVGMWEAPHIHGNSWCERHAQLYERVRAKS